MVSIRWCIEKRNGLELVRPNQNMSKSYLMMAEESITAIQEVESIIWKATMGYYIFYYSLYSLMMSIGVKCEIHSCSLKFMKSFLKDFYDNKDIEMIEKAFSARINLQYYADRPVDKKEIDETVKYCKDFYVKTKDIISRMTEKQMKSIRYLFGQEIAAQGKRSKA